MPNITGVVTQNDSVKTTYYTDTATTTAQTFFFQEEQDGMTFTSKGSSILTLAIAGKTYKIPPYASINIDDDKFISFEITSISGSQSFEINSYVKMNQVNSLRKQTGVSVYNADIGLRRWRTSLAKVKTQTNQIINLNVVGDSISEGGYSDPTVPQNYINKGYVGLIRNALASKYGNVGKGAIPCYYPNTSPFWSISNGFTISASTAGFASRYCYSSTTGTATFSFNGTGVKLFFGKGTILGQFNYSIDGGSSVLVDTNGTLDTAASLSITGLADTDHTMTITKVNDGKQLWLFGHQEIKGTNGVRVNMVGRWGITASAIIPPDCLKLGLDVWNPNLTIISLTANDYGTQTDLATYRTNIQTIISRALQFGDVLLTTVGAHSDIVGSIPQQSYFDIVRDLAIQNGCAYIDIASRWGGGANANSLGLLYDTVHPNNFGHQDIASAILRVIDEY